MVYECIYFSLVVGIQVDGNIIISPNDILYTGMMYHEQKTLGHWKTYYTVVRDLDVLKQVLELMQLAHVH